MRILKLHTIICFCSLLVFSFCRKKDPAPASDQPCVNTTSYWGSLTIDQRFAVNSNTITQIGRFPMIYLSKQGSCSKAPSSVQGGIISFNSKIQTLTNPNFWSTINITDTVSQNTQPPFVWNSGGSSEFPSFTENVNDSIPEFFKWQQLPDTVSKSGGVTIQLAGKNADNVIVTITDSFSGNTSITVPATSVGCSLSMPAAIIQANTNGTLSVSYEKTYTKTIQGVQVFFNTRGTYNKNVYIKN